MESLTENAKKLLNICKECPLYSIKFGGQCNPKLYLNPKTEEVSTSPKTGFINGCGCMLIKKVQDPTQVCPAGKW